MTGPSEGPGGRPSLPLAPVGLQAVGALQALWRRVEVPGGDLAVAAWGEPSGARDLVVGIHGLTGNALVWAGVAGLLDGAPPLVAPDLRGRGLSRTLPGPHGLRAHVADVAAVLDALAAQRVTLVGHGSGAHVAVLLAELRPDRVARLVLVDPDATPPGDLLARTAVAPVTREQHRTAWREELGLPWNALVAALVDHDVVGEEPDLRRAVASEAVEADLRDLAARPLLAPQRPLATRPLLAPQRPLAARPPRPVLAGAGLPATVLVVPGEGGSRREGLVPVPGASHWSLLLGLRGADVVAQALLTG